jgi:predicted ester cyclase
MTTTASHDLVVDTRVERNKATVRHMFDRLSAGDVGGYTQHLVPQYQRHCQAMPPELQEIRGSEAMHAWLASNLISFPDFQEEVEMLVGEGDFVSWRSRATGTQSGPMGPFPSTNKRMDVVIVGMHRFEGDQVAETWTSWDNLAVLTQLGHMAL